MNLTVEINIFLLYMSSNILLPYKRRQIRLLSLCKKALEYFLNHSLGWLSAHYRNGSAKNGVLWFQLQHCMTKVDLVCL